MTSISAAQQSIRIRYIYTHSFFFFILSPPCSNLRDCTQSHAVQQDPITYPLQMQESAFTKPKLLVHPSLSSSPHASTSLLSMSMICFCLVDRVICRRSASVTDKGGVLSANDPFCCSWPWRCTPHAPVCQPQFPRRGTLPPSAIPTTGLRTPAAAVPRTWVT